MRGVAVQNGCVAGADLTGMVEHDDLSVKRSGRLGRVVLGVGRDVSTTDILDGHVLDVETDVVTGRALWDLLVMHLNRLHLS